MKINEKQARRAKALAQRYGKGVGHVIAYDCNPMGLQWQERIYEGSVLPKLERGVSTRLFGVS